MSNIWNLVTSTELEDCIKDIQKEVAEVGFKTWIESIQDIERKGNTLTLTALNEFSKDVLETKYLDLFRSIFKNIGIEEIDIISHDSIEGSKGNKVFDIGMKVAIIMGSESDYDVMKKTEELLKDFEVEFETKVLSAHRNPIETLEFSKTAEEKGFDVIIAGAGKAAHLPGVLASMTTLPVVGVPIKSGSLGGVDALFSIVQMPRGVPVATVGINESENAAILAIQMLAINDKKLKDKLNKYKMKLK